MKELIDGGFLYIATPPLYLSKKVKTSAMHGMMNNALLSLKEMAGEGKEESVNTQRYKGLEK